MSVNTKINGQLVKSASLTKAIVPLGLGDCYSTDEKQVGVWVDGKPLYQKTIDVGSLPNTSSKSVAHNISNIDFVPLIILTAKDSSGTAVSIPFVSNSFAYQMTVYIAGENIRIDTFSNRTAFSGYVTIQYTKTTDTAGSGIWTPSGAQADHYSTDEQVIGTWIDGDTLYRRTITGLSLALNGTNWVNYTAVSNIKKLIHLDAYYEATDGRLLHCSIAEFQSLANGGLQLCATSSTFNRTINVMTIEYTKTS